MAEQEVLLSVDDGAARIRLNRPDQRNAVVGPMRAAEVAIGAERWTPEQLLAVGAVTRVLDPEEIEADALSFASALAELDRTTVVSAKVVPTSGLGGPAVWRADLVGSS